MNPAFNTMDWTSFRLITAGFAAAACFILGFFVFIKNRSGHTNRIFALSNLILGAWNISDIAIASAPTPSAALFIYRVSFIWGILLVPSFFYLCAEIAGTNIKNNPFVKMLAGFAVFLIILLFTPWLIKSIELSPYKENPGVLYPCYIVFFACWLGYGINLIFRSYRDATGIKKNQLKYMFIAMFFGFCAGIYYTITVMDPSIPPVFYILEIAYTGIVAYAIIRYKLMDISLVFRYATIYILFAGIIGTPVLVLSWLAKSWILSTALGLVAVLTSPYLFDKFKSVLTAAVDQLPPFRGRYERVNNLKKYQEAITLSQTMDEWACKIVQAIQDLFNPEGANVLVYDESLKLYIMKFGVRLGFIETNCSSLTPEDPIISSLTKDRNMLVRELARQPANKENYGEVIHVMDLTHAELCLPLFIKDRLVSVLNVDRKTNKEMYNDLDLSALWGLAKVAEETLRGILTSEEIIRKERLAAIGEMASMVGHEIRTPLTVIGNSIYYLERKFPEFIGKDSVSKHFNVINAQIHSANKIISEILDYARDRELILESGSINDLICETLSMAEIPKNIQVVIELSKDIPPSLFDKEEMAQAVANILHNALESMPEGGTLRIASALLPDEIELRFTDTGCGIPKENLEKIFEPLFTTKAKGTGLGMAIVKKIVERHRGTIQLESKVGRGTTIIVRYPQPPSKEILLKAAKV